MGNVDRKFLKNVKVITGEWQHRLVIVDIDKKQKKKTEWKLESKKRNVAKLRDERFECRVKEIMSDNNHALWRSFKDVPKACDEVCRYKKNMK